MKFRDRQHLLSVVTPDLKFITAINYSIGLLKRNKEFHLN